MSAPAVIAPAPAGPGTDAPGHPGGAPALVPAGSANAAQPAATGLPLAGGARCPGTAATPACRRRCRAGEAGRDMAHSDGFRDGRGDARIGLCAGGRAVRRSRERDLRPPWASAGASARPAGSGTRLAPRGAASFPPAAACPTEAVGSGPASIRSRCWPAAGARCRPTAGHRQTGASPMSWPSSARPAASTKPTRHNRPGDAQGFGRRPPSPNTAPARSPANSPGGGRTVAGRSAPARHGIALSAAVPGTAR